MFGFIGSLIIGLIAGLLATWIMPGGSKGCLWNTLLGLAGGALGGWLAKLLHVSTPDTWYWDVLIGVVGACILIAVYNLISGKRK